MLHSSTTEKSERSRKENGMKCEIISYVREQNRDDLRVVYGNVKG